MEPMFAAGQRGKRALALDLKAPGAAAVLDRLFRWSDVVHHNSRVGLAEKLGYDEATVRASNPGVVYSFASGFGEHGPRAPLPANDQLMQALSGIEAGQGGDGQPPTYLVWGAVDVAGGWLAACGMIAALYARRRHGGGQSVSASLLGGALTMKGGWFLDADGPAGGPVLDAGQTGYGAACRIYQGRDGAWFALVIPDAAAWAALRAVARLPGLPPSPPPVRTRGGSASTGAQPEELLLADCFRGRDAAHWVAELRSAGVPAEPVAEPDRAAYAAGFVDDPVNRQLGRVASHHWGERGLTDQPCFPPRFGPAARPRARPSIPGLGEHTQEVLRLVGFDDGQRAGLTASGTAGPALPGWRGTAGVAVPLASPYRWRRRTAGVAVPQASPYRRRRRTAGVTVPLESPYRRRQGARRSMIPPPGEAPTPEPYRATSAPATWLQEVPRSWRTPSRRWVMPWR
jgi:crotonobetainyl-CoA:carnitine CoA-transferase CaiB-like acyl-CoA transferase